MGQNSHEQWVEPKLGLGWVPVYFRDVMLEIAGVCSWAEVVEPSSGVLGRAGIFSSQKWSVSSLQILPVKLAGRKLGQAGNWCERVKPSRVWPQRGTLPIWRLTLLTMGLLPFISAALKFYGNWRNLLSLTAWIQTHSSNSLPLSLLCTLLNPQLESWLCLLLGFFPTSCYPSFCKGSCPGNRALWISFHVVIKDLVFLEWGGGELPRGWKLRLTFIESLEFFMEESWSSLLYIVSSDQQ